jgi:hypothetical protein
MKRVHRAATNGPADLLAFVAAIERLTDSTTNREKS